MSRKNFNEAQNKYVAIFCSSMMHLTIIDRFFLAVKQCPDSGWYLLCLGRSHLLSADNRQEAYSSLIKV